jgi:hypothetical protein
MRGVLKNGVVTVRRAGIRVTYQNSIGKQVDSERAARTKSGQAGGVYLRKIFSVVITTAAQSQKHFCDISSRSRSGIPIDLCLETILLFYCSGIKTHCCYVSQTSWRRVVCAKALLLLIEMSHSYIYRMQHRIL